MTQLNERERFVAQLRGEGKTLREIAAALPPCTIERRGGSWLTEVIPSTAPLSLARIRQILNKAQRKLAKEQSNG